MPPGDWESPRLSAHLPPVGPGKPRRRDCPPGWSRSNRSNFRFCREPTKHHEGALPLREAELATGAIVHHNSSARQLRHAWVAQIDLRYPQSRWSVETNVTSLPAVVRRTSARSSTSTGMALPASVPVLECAVPPRGTAREVASRPLHRAWGRGPLSTGCSGDDARMIISFRSMSPVGVAR
jgi:hypothetical protein